MSATKERGKRRLVLVEWVDSHSGQGWQPLDEIARGAIPVYCRSVGWLVSEANGMKVLVAHVSGEGNEDIRKYGKGDIAIPERAIVRLSNLHEGRGPGRERRRAPGLRNGNDARRVRAGRGASHVAP